MEIKHDAVAWTVHWFQSVLLFLVIDEEDVLLIFEIVATLHPKFRVIDVRTNDFVVPSDFVLGSHEFDQSVINDSSMGLEKGTSRGKVSEVEQVLLRTDGPVISLSELLLYFDVLVELGLFGEGNCIDPLQVIVFLVAQPIS